MRRRTDDDAGASPAPPPGGGPDPAARWAVTAVFVCNGMLVASWVVRIPDVQATLSLPAGTLGLVLGAMPVGVLSALPLAGGLVPRLGSRRVTLIGAVIGVLALPLAGLAPGPLALAGCLLGLGAGTAIMDVGMNAQGIGVQASYGRSILVGMHAAWSLGSVVAAGAGAAAMQLAVPVGAHLGTVSVVVLTGTLGALPWLRIADRHPRDGAPRPRLLALPHGPLVPIALVALGAALGESSASDWSGIFMRDAAGIDPSRASWGFVTFSGAMMVGRLLGDRIADRLGPVRTIAVGGRLTGAGFLLLAAVPHPAVALTGFAAAGLGVAAITPLAFAAAGRRSASAGTGMAAVATVAHLGFLLAPPLVGQLAELADLRWSLALVGLAVAACTARPRGFLGGPDTSDATDPSVG